MAIALPISKPKPTIIGGLRASPWYWRFFRDTVKCIGDLKHRYGPVVAVASPLPNSQRLYVVASGETYNRQILSDNESFRTTGHMFSVGPPGSAMRRIRRGLSCVRGDEHRRSREMMKPLFSMQAIEGYCDQFVEATRLTTDRWQPGETIQLDREIDELARRLSSYSLFGSESEERLNALSKRIHEMSKLTFAKRIWAFPINVPGAPFRRMTQLAETIEKQIVQMIRRRKKDPTGKMDALERLVHSVDDDGWRLRQWQLVGQIFFLFSASYETTAAALTWALILLSQHPDVACKLVDEVDSVLGGSPPSAEKLRELKFTEAVLKETMRLLPPVPTLARVSNISTSVGGLRIQKGDRLVVSPYYTHRSPEIYAQPQRFDPERWFHTHPNPYQYLPFGAGPRYCVGASYGMTLMKICLAHIVQKFRLSLPGPARIDRACFVVMRPRGSVPMCVQRQDRNYAPVPLRGTLTEMVDFTTQ